MAVLGHIFVHILVAYRCLLKGDAFPLQSLVESEVGHNGGDNRIVYQASLLLHVLSADIHDLVAVHQISLAVYSQAAVCVPVVGKAHVQAVLHHVLLQSLDMSGSAVGVDIYAVRIVVDHMGFCAQSVKHVLGNGGSASVGTVQSHLLIFEGAGGNGNQIADIAVSSCRIVYGTANLLSHSIRNLSHLPVQVLLNLCDNFFFQLLTLLIDDLDSIVIEWVMAGGNHNSAAELLCADHIGNAGSRGDVEQVCVCS